jgi:hypothetical protein
MIRDIRISSIDWEGIKEKMPFHKDNIDDKKFNELMKIFDVNGNGYLSLAELDKGLQAMGPVMEPVYKAKKPVMMAYQKAKSYMKGNDDYVSLKELKFFFVYLY